MLRSDTRNDQKMQVIPLGGLGEIGKNMTVVRFGDEMIVIGLQLFNRKPILPESNNFDARTRRSHWRVALYPEKTFCACLWNKVDVGNFGRSAERKWR